MKFIKSIAASLIFIIVVSGCSSKDKSQKAAARDAKASVNTERTTNPVKVMILSKSKIARNIDYTATVLPFEEVNMAPSTPGRIDRIFVEVGDHVSKGSDLFLMDRTQLYQLQLQLSSLEKDLNRLDTLLKTGSAKQQQYDQMKTQYDVTKTNVDFMAENTLLKSPFNGIVTGKYYEDGEMYSGAPTSTSGKAAVVTVMQVNPLKVIMSISEQYYPLIKKGMKASVVADVFKDETYTGTVFLVAPTVNTASRSFNVEIELPNRNEHLKPGMFVRVALELGEVETFVVPANTVLVQEGTNIRYVFVEENGTAKRVEVEIGKRFDDKLEIISDDLKEGARLIAEGQARLLSGDKVDVVE